MRRDFLCAPPWLPNHEARQPKCATRILRHDSLIELPRLLELEEQRLTRGLNPQKFRNHALSTPTYLLELEARYLERASLSFISRGKMP